jgi:Myb-like DNA-binding domain
MNAAMPSSAEAQPATERAETEQEGGEAETSRSERRAWSRDEDESITRLVTHYGIKRWSLIAQHLEREVPGSVRSGKQCRTR